MDIKDYQKIVEQTAVYPAAVSDFGKCYTILGFLGEYKEWEDAKRGSEEEMKERFDIVWYACAICKEFNLNFQEVIAAARWGGVLTSAEFNRGMEYNIYEAVKKYYRDGKPIVAADLIDWLIVQLDPVISEREITDWEFFNGLGNNYQKLLKRRETGTLHGDGDNRENQTI
jgi:hypothetical protein